jgi:signal transduction histidine kinase
MEQELNLLLVEDNPGDARLIREMLGGSRTQTSLSHAETLADARQQALGNACDIVLLDLGLPDSQGLDTIVRFTEALPEIPIVVLTGNDDDAVAVQAVKHGAQDYIVKADLNEKLLQRTVSYALERHRARQEREQSEEARRSLETSFRTLILRSVDAMIVTDRQGVIRFLNPSAERLFGREAAELIGAPFGASGLGDETTEIEIVRRDRSDAAAEMVSTDIEWEGKPAKLLSLRDVTERKKMQQRLIVTDRLASIGELVAGVAHELNNPLTAVVGFSELLMQQEVPANIAESLTIITDESKRCIRIVDNLLKFGRRQLPTVGGVEINELLRRILEMRAYEQQASNVRQVAHFADGLPPVKGDGAQLQQVFINLVINAEYFINEQGQGGDLTVTTEAVADRVRVSVSDQGPGITESDLENIFDPFFTTKPVGKGTGLGLSICHGIIQEHQGSIQARNNPGGGATFVVELPRFAEQVAPQTVPVAELS